MVVHIVYLVVYAGAMTDVPLTRLLITALRVLVDEMHRRLTAAGHPGLRPAHGFALNAVGENGTTTVRLGELLGMTKQGAAKLVRTLTDLGYLHSAPHDHDGRARLLRLTPRGLDALHTAAAIQRDLEAELADRIGGDDARALRRALHACVRHAVHADPATVPLRPLW